ncbi:hypothetical protein ABIE56_000574 [Luteibacter sp. 621]|uniref:DUF262 domain-containing protein n=1 Tax=Luteibacter sp. 621 TaxID=3373916 RepID=UPI003D1B2175
MATRKKTADLADVLFPTKDEQDFAESILSIPPEQRKLHTETYDFTVETLVEKLDDGSAFIPNFQRKYVWSDSQASRLIESLIIQCPVPVIYMNQEQDEKLSVIDGNQRLTSISRYLKNEFVLKGLTAYPELEGNRFHELDPRFQRHIQNRTLRCIVILKDTHPQVKFDVFERLNTGATKLTPQELRHGLYYGDLIREATQSVSSSHLLSMLDIKVDKRMKAEELVLRFWSLDEGFDAYRKPLATFINDFADKNRALNPQKKAALKMSFQAALDAVHGLFGDLSFRIFGKDLKVQSTFNAALYDALMIGLSRAMKGKGIKVMSSAHACQVLAGLIADDAKFRRAISVATSDDAQVKYRVTAITEAFGN